MYNKREKEMKLLNRLKTVYWDSLDNKSYELSRIHDCTIDIFMLDGLSDEQLKSIFFLLPREIFGNAIQWGFSDTVVGDNIYEWLSKNKQDILKIIAE